MEEYIALAHRLFSHKLDGFRDCIKQSNQVEEVMARHLSKRPFHLNVIEAACHGHFKETGHCLVLADMLKFPAIQSSFLETFLGLTHDYLTVTSETDRVDVALKGDDFFVIIENKVNGAVEQKQQVNRYVYKVGKEKYGYTLSQIYVVYLNSTGQDMPSNFSLCDDNGTNNAFTALGDDHWRVISYKKDIMNWLRNIQIDCIKDKEPHIHSALDQYIDFLEQKFHTSPLDREMNNEIKNFLSTEFQLENKSLDEQLDILGNQREKVNDLLVAIDDLKLELKKRLSNKLIREWQDQITRQYGINLNSDKQSFGIQLNNKVWLGIWDGSDSPKNTPYWGFQYDPYRKNDMPELYQQIKDLLNSVGIEPEKEEANCWIAWGYTEEGVKEFITLYNRAKETGLL